MPADWPSFKCVLAAEDLLVKGLLHVLIIRLCTWLQGLDPFLDDAVEVT